MITTKKALPESEGERLWETRRRDWHRIPGNDRRKQVWYNPAYCAEAVVFVNEVGNVVNVKVYSAV